MIKGSASERIEYAEYVREHAIYLDYNFQIQQKEFEKIYRYYRILSFKRDLTQFEIDAANFAFFAQRYLLYIGNVVYIGFKHEWIPSVISAIKPQKPTQIVPLHEISKVLLQYPKTVLEAVLLHTNISYDLLNDGIRAHQEVNPDALTKIISQADISTLWPSYVILNMFEQYSLTTKHKNWSDIKDFGVVVNGNTQDIFCMIGVEAEVESFEYPLRYPNFDLHKLEGYFERLNDRFESQDNMFFKELIVYSIILAESLYNLSDRLLGEYDPITETIYEMVSSQEFILIMNMYTQHFREDRIEEMRLSVLNFIHSLIQGNSFEDEFLYENNEATDITLMRFFDEVFVFDANQRNQFINKYLNHLTEFFKAIDSMTALYSFAALFYPQKMKLGRYPKDEITAATRLSGGIQWSEHPSGINDVVDSIKVLNRSKLDGLKSVKNESVTPPKRVEHLVDRYIRQSSQYSWIKDFIEDYWPKEAKDEFAAKLKLKK